MIRRIAIIIACAMAGTLAAVPAVAQRIVGAAGQWAALDFGRHCEAGTRSTRRAANNRVQARAGFRFDRSGTRRGEFYARLSRTPRGGSTVLLTVGERPFLLVRRDDWAWSRDGQQAAAIVDAVRLARGMRIEARDSAGRRIVDRYLLDGAPTAIDAAAVACLIEKGRSRDRPHIA